jgi:heat shock protein HslJ
MRTLTCFFVMTLLTAAAEVRYGCPDGVAFTVRTQEAPVPGFAVLEAAERRPLVLPRVESASGEKFSDGYTVLWMKGEEAMVESGTLTARGCRAVPPKTALSGRWTLVELAGMPVRTAREAFLEFDPAAARAAGSTGCNRFSSGYAENGQALKFQGAVSTRIACPPPAMELEQRFLKALTAVAEYRIEREMLVLVDGAGQVVARLRSGE